MINTDRPWLSAYEEGVAHDIDLSKYQSLLPFFDEAIDRFGSLEAFECMGVSITYNKLDELANNFASYLQCELRLKKGDKIAIQMPNSLQYPVVVLGALRAGLIVVNTNPLYTSDEMKHQFTDAGIKAIVIVENFAFSLESIRHDLPELKHIIVTKLGDMLGPAKGAIVNLVVKHFKGMVPKYNLKGSIPFKKTIKSKLNGYQEVPLTQEDTAFLQYTGGTTGVSKGAVLLHKNLLANALQHQEIMRNKLTFGKEVVVTALPLYHIFAFTVNFLTFFGYGAKNLLITNPRDMKSFLKELRKPFTVLTGVNTLFNGMLHQEEFKNCDFSALHTVIGGGMPVLQATSDEWEQVTGVKLNEGYGLTECSPVVSVSPLSDNKIKLGTIGVPLPSTYVRLVDEDFQDVAIGERGELCVKGPQVMAGYWKNELETENVFMGEYVRTGDIAIMDDQGYISIVDRKKEMILVSGFNVYPKEIEDVLTSHPKVLEVGVKGVPNAKSNEVPKAFVVKKDPSLTEEELRAFCKEHLTSYKRPKEYAFREELPKTNVGKILRRALE